MPDAEPFDIAAHVPPETLTAALKSAGLLRGARVVALNASVIGRGQGLTSALWRIIPTYSEDDAAAPRSVIAKMSSASGDNREIALALRFMERECRAYANIGRTGMLERPVCYHQAVDPDSGDGLLLLEDLGALAAEDQVAGIRPPRARTALAALASFHAEWWRSPATRRSLGLPRFDDPVIVGTVEKIYAAAWPAFLETYESRLPARFLRILEQVGAAIGPLAGRLASGPVTVLHGDFRADNLFFGRKDGKKAVWAIDWQIACIGAGVFDAAYFLSQSVSTDAASERGLLEEYHQALFAGGVTDYPFEQCLADYRRAVIYGLVYVVIACGLMGAADARSARLCDALLRRVEPFALAHYAPSLL